MVSWELLMIGKRGTNSDFGLIYVLGSSSQPRFLSNARTGPRPRGMHLQIPIGLSEWSLSLDSGPFHSLSCHKKKNQEEREAREPTKEIRTVIVSTHRLLAC